MRYEETARRLREALDDNNLRPVDIAKKTGISKASMSQYCNGVNRPNNISAGKMAKILNVNPMWLMGFEVDKNQYTMTEAESLARQLYDRPELKVLFDSSKNASKEDIERVAELLKKLSK